MRHRWAIVGVTMAGAMITMPLPSWTAASSHSPALVEQCHRRANRHLVSVSAVRSEE